MLISLLKKCDTLPHPCVSSVVLPRLEMTFRQCMYMQDAMCKVYGTLRNYRVGLLVLTKALFTFMQSYTQYMYNRALRTFLNIYTYIHRHWKPLCLYSRSGYGPGVNLNAYITPRPINMFMPHMNAVHTLTHLPRVCFICICTTDLLPHVIGLYKIFLWSFKNWATPSELFFSKLFIITGCLYRYLANFCMT